MKVDKVLIDRFQSIEIDSSKFNTKFFPVKADILPEWEKIYELESIVKPGLQVLLKDDNLPEILVRHAEVYVKELVELFVDFKDIVYGVPSTTDERKLDEYRDQFFSKQYSSIRQRFNAFFHEKVYGINKPSGRFTLLEVFSGIVAFGKKEEKIDVESIKRDFQSSIDSEKKKVTDVLSNVSEKNTAIETLLKGLQEKAKSVITENYSQKFKDQAETHNWVSYLWLGIGVLTMLIFFILIFCTDIYNRLPTETLSERGSIYNLTNIVLKIAIISIQIFFISFAFKQFSVNRHLYTVNKHRANAFDSYDFFAKAVKDDKDSTNTLMLQLAKAIYEQSSTGYLTEKGNVNPGILEITQLIKGANGG